MKSKTVLDYQDIAGSFLEILRVFWLYLLSNKPSPFSYRLFLMQEGEKFYF